jgi:hypothetical protein
VYGHPDDDYRRRALEFGRESLLAYCVVVRYFRRQEFYRSREPVWHRRPIEEAVRQVRALNERLGVQPWEATPPGAGVAFFCRSCHRWSTRVQEVRMQRLWEVGECNHYVDPRDGESYCKWTKFDKAALIKRRDDAGCDRREEQPDETSSDEEDDAGNVDNADDPFLLDWDDEGNPIITGERTHNPVMDNAPHPTPATHERRFLSQALTMIGPMRVYAPPCGTNPLREVDMLGLWYRLKKSFYGLCVICGNLTMVDQRKLTPIGLVCGNHDEHVPRPPAHPLILDRPRVCAACGTDADAWMAGHVIRVYDEEYQMMEVPLCKVHLGALARVIPVSQIGFQRASNVYPVALAQVCVVLRAFTARQRPPRPSVEAPAPLSVRERLKRVVEAGVAPPALQILFMRGETMLSPVDFARLAMAEAQLDAPHSTPGQ